MRSVVTSFSFSRVHKEQMKDLYFIPEEFLAGGEGMCNFEIRLRGQSLGADLHVQLVKVPTPNILFTYWMESSGSRRYSR